MTKPAAFAMVRRLTKRAAPAAFGASMSSNGDPRLELEEYSPLVQWAARNARLAGAISLGAGAILFKAYIVNVLESARNGSLGDTTISTKLVWFSVILPEIGLMYLVGGSRAVLWFAQKRGAPRLRAPQMLVAVALVAIAELGHQWFCHELRKYGYEVGR